MSNKQSDSNKPSTYNLRIDSQVAKALLDFQPKHFKQIVMKILSLQQNPRPQDYKKLIGYEGGYRVDQGEYRILYTIDDTQGLVTVFIVGKRGDDEVYREFERKGKK